jgi:hypothetical protein
MANGFDSFVNRVSSLKILVKNLTYVQADEVTIEDRESR